jgi:hypothetical protein
MSITRLGLGGYPERKKPEILFEPPPIDYDPETTPAEVVFTDLAPDPTTPPTDVDSGVTTIFTDIIPTSDDDLIPTQEPDDA